MNYQFTFLFPIFSNEKEGAENQSLEELWKIDNLAALQCPTPMQTDEDNQLNTMSDCLTV